MKRTALVVVVVASLSAVVAGQTGTKNGEWPTYGGDLGNTRYAPLDQITAANFNSLEVAWRFKTDNLGPRPEFNLESTPLMVKGVLYSTGGHAARRRRARCRDRRAAVDAQRERGSARRGRAASALRPRPRLLERRQGGAHPLRHARLSARRARREDRQSRPRLRHQRHRRSEAEPRSDDRSALGRDRSSRDAGRRAQRGDRRRRAPVRRRADGQDQRQRLRPRLRRAHGQAAVDLPHDSRAG